MKKSIKMRIVGLNYDEFFYHIKVNNAWKQFKKPVGKFIHMMYALYPDIMKQADAYHFDDQYQLANWLYNYGYEKGKTYTFSN